MTIYFVDSKEIKTLLIRCRLACGTEAIAFGFPPKVGYEIFKAYVVDRIDEAIQEDFITWGMWLSFTYGRIGSDGQTLLDLNSSCREIIRDYDCAISKAQEQKNKST